jgi:hypothetical protein
MEVTNYWGLFVVPVGVILCFGPALIAWALTEDRAEPPSDQKRQ